MSSLARYIIVQTLEKKIQARNAKGQETLGDLANEIIANLKAKGFEIKPSATPSQDEGEALRRALEPFARLADQVSDVDYMGANEFVGWSIAGTKITVGDLRRAREALSRSPEGKSPPVASLPRGEPSITDARLTFHKPKEKP